MLAMILTSPPRKKSGKGFHHADDQPAEKGTDEISHCAQHHDHKGHDRKALPDGRDHPVVGGQQGAANGGHGRADAKGQQINVLTLMPISCAAWRDWDVARMAAPIRVFCKNM